MPALPILVFILFAIVFLWYGIKLLISRNFKNYEEQISNYLKKEGLTLNKIQKPTKNDWQNAPFKKPSAISVSSGTITILGMQMPLEDSEYRVIETAEGINVWVKLSTRFLSSPKLTFKSEKGL